VDLRSLGRLGDRGTGHDRRERADGKAWFSKTFGLGQSAPGPTTWATPRLKIRIESTSLNSGAMGLGAVGTPEVYCTQ
jgi:hypothetical protein